MGEYFGPNQISKRSAVKSYGIVFLLIVIFFAGWSFGSRQNDELQAQDPEVTGQGYVAEFYAGDADFQIFWDVWQDIKDNYVRQPIEDIDLFYGAMRGLLAGTGDPYSDFFNPETAAAFDQELSGTFSGIGVEIGKKNDLIVIIAPLEGSPATEVGIKAGDAILAIEDIDAYGMSLDRAVSLIRGEEGTTVTLTIISKNADAPRDVVVTRQKIEHTGLRWEYIDDIAHLKLSSFDSDTENLLNKFIREIERKGDIKGIVLDMRNDPGGFLDMAIEVASEWIEDGVILIEKDYAGNERVHQARGRARLARIPTVVLVNEGSASAAEIVAGALQDHEIAKVVGENTFGKGSVQRYEPLEDGSAYKLTIALWFTPSGRGIDETGISPDFEIELMEEDFNNDRDPQLDKAIELLNQ